MNTRASMIISFLVQSLLVTINSFQLQRKIRTPWSPCQLVTTPCRFARRKMYAEICTKTSRATARSATANVSWKTGKLILLGLFSWVWNYSISCEFLLDYFRNQNVMQKSSSRFDKEMYPFKYEIRDKAQYSTLLPISCDAIV